jgi:hypothetical protein
VDEVAVKTEMLKLLGLCRRESLLQLYKLRGKRPGINRIQASREIKKEK